MPTVPLIRSRGKGRGGGGGGGGVGGGIFKDNAVNEEDPDLDRATPAYKVKTTVYDPKGD